ncbi:hypothetical protein, partial [Streptococcus pseudopneumoniae]|uniref:hypothetical protein n=1 Tax=Streptococcus pseudopneumoniae TaxID=257758 RepID=UPI001BB19F4A
QHVGFENILDDMDKKLINVGSYGNKLYSTIFDNIELRFLTYPDIDDPKRKRISFVKPDLETADKSMSWKHNCSIEDYHKMEVLQS